MSFFEELKRRNVFRVGIAYTITGWVLLQVVDLVLDNVEAPSWVMHVFMLAVSVGFIVALIIAWAYEVTPEGIKRESDVTHDESITHHTAKKLDVITLGAIGLLVVFLLLDRFVLEAPAERTANPTDQAQASAPGELAATPPDAKAVPQKSIAVLPLANRSVNPEDAFFAEGIHDEILTRLSRVADLKVISRTSVMGYANTSKKMAEIGRELSVAHLLEGGVQRAGNRVRINVQLIEAATDKHLWAEIFDRELTADNLFDIQSEITRSISDELQAVLSGEERRALGDKPTENLEAYAYYLRAKAMAQGYGRGLPQIEESISIYESALALDPGFAEAWAALAIDWLEAHWSSTRARGERDQAEAALARAQALAPDSAETLIAEGYLHYWGYREYGKALNAFDAALSRKPGSVLALRGNAYVLRRMGRLETCVANFRRAIELDPNDAAMPSDLSYTLLHMGRMEESELMSRRALAQVPDNDWSRYVFAGYFLVLGDLQRAAEVIGPPQAGRSDFSLIQTADIARMQGDTDLMNAALDLFGDTATWKDFADLVRARALFSQGQLESYRDRLGDIEARALSNADSMSDPQVPLNFLALVYGLTGQTEKLEAVVARQQAELKPDAMRLVEDSAIPSAWAMVGEHGKALDIAEQVVEEFGIWEFYTFVLDPVFDGLRGEPRYKQLALRYDRWLEDVKRDEEARKLGG